VVLAGALGGATARDQLFLHHAATEGAPPFQTFTKSLIKILRKSLIKILRKSLIKNGYNKNNEKFDQKRGKGLIEK